MDRVESKHAQSQLWGSHEEVSPRGLYKTCKPSSLNSWLLPSLELQVGIQILSVNLHPLQSSKQPSLLDYV